MVGHRIASLLLSIVFLSLVSVRSLVAQETPLPSARDVVLTLVQSGMELRHQGNVKAALDLYHQALAVDPDNANVLYELCLSYLQLGDCRKSLEFGERGAKKDSELRGHFYAAMGNCYDEQGELEKAIVAYREGIAVDPNAPMIRYNLAYTYVNAGRLLEAEETIKDELRINPEHPSSHALLALLYTARGERIPALLATLRFLVLESDSPRSEGGVKRVTALLVDGGAETKNSENGGGDIPFDTGESSEGDFGGVELMLEEMTAAGPRDSVERSNYQVVTALLSATLDMIAAKSDAGKGFAAEYYVPYFSAAREAGKTEMLIRTVMMSHGDPEAQAWLSGVENMKAIQEFLEWSQGFEWKGK